MITQQSEPVAWRFRWKLNGIWTRWHVTDQPMGVGPFVEPPLKDLEVVPLYLKREEVKTEVVPLYLKREEVKTPDTRVESRFFVLDDHHVVCAGGRWDGWRFWRHSDGDFVSVERLEELPAPKVSLLLQNVFGVDKKRPGESESE